MTVNGTKTTAPQSSHKTVPLKKIDTRPPVGNIRTQVYFIIRGRLDQQLLRTSLDKLIRTHLPVLGAKIKHATKKGELHHYHYPSPFPDDAVLFSWSSSSVNTSLEASNLLIDVTTIPVGAVAWGRSTENHEAAWSPAGWPLECKDDGPDTPLLLVHFTSYQDATVLGVNIPHSVADQKGIASMMEAWISVAQGKQPPPFLALQPDALDGPADLPASVLRRKGRYRLKSRREYVGTILGILPDLIKNREEEVRLLFLSSAAVMDLRDRCNDELKTKYGLDHVPLTNGDIVTSILSKFAYLDRKKPRYLTISETVAARGRHPSLPPGAHYLYNCPAYACARFKFSRDTPLAEVARYHRLAVNETTTVAAIERSFAIHSKVFDGAGQAFPVCEPGEIPYSVTNWSSAWPSVDFSPLLLDGEAPGVSEDKSLMLVFGRAITRNVKIRRLFAPVMCKADGGYWVDFGCTKKTMGLVDELLKRDPMLTTL
ncbi:hypothetical protein ACHAQA_006756 [Verticillium albo-atrum]